MFETETVGPCLVRKLKWGGGCTPLLPSPPVATPLFYVNTARKKFSFEDSFSKCEQIRSCLQIYPYLLKRPLIEDFYFCVVEVAYRPTSFKPLFPDRATISNKIMYSKPCVRFLQKKFIDSLYWL